MHDGYENPLGTRYASKAMIRVFSARHRFTLWRKLWLALAECEAELGLSITEAQLAELRDAVDKVDIARADVLERELRHDVMAHVHALREQCPTAGPIVHLGATSCFVTDNSELIQMRAGMELLMSKLRGTIRNLRAFAMEHRALPTLAWTHFQPAQFTTVGKRAALWMQDLVDDHNEMERLHAELRFRGVKGTTGTQDSFLKLFNGDVAKVKELDKRVSRRMGFNVLYALTGQTYSRKQDARVLGGLSSIAQSAGKFSSDVRLLQHLNEVEEPFGSKQIGSSAMAYKRNPMRCERMAGLARWLITISLNPALTASTQWMERTLDDSANRRLATGEAFLAADAILELYLNVTRGLVVHPDVVARRVQEHLPTIASEELLMEAVKAGGDRQELHELIRVAAMEAREVRLAGGDGDFLGRLALHKQFSTVLPALKERLDARRFTGLAAVQVEDYVRDCVDPLLQRFPVQAHSDEVSL
ncbi:MAG: adenylosuccinate lyase [Planctomycetes bacterium]|nr:adenylosuccinate lyase [Planctomycetota bacterium]